MTLSRDVVPRTFYVLGIYDIGHPQYLYTGILHLSNNY